MRFLVDAQLPPALARRIAASGHEAEHVVDCGLVMAGDGAIERYAANTGAVVVTKDADFAVRKALRGTEPAVIWIRFGNTRKAELLRRMDVCFPDAVAALQNGEKLIEIT